MRHVFDFLVIGSGSAGLSYALKMAQHGTVGVITKRGRHDSATSVAQGGIAAVVDDADSFEAHVRDTIEAGAGLNRPEVVRLCVEEAPARLRELMDLGVQFTRRGAGPEDDLDLGREGGHSARRIVHAKDMTGRAIQQALVAAAAAEPNIRVFERHHAIDLITRRRLGLRDPDRCVGAYVLSEEAGRIETFLAGLVMVATGGAGKVYRYTSNPDAATGDGIAMAWRAGAQIANMEFFQFHPTVLYHPGAKNFLVSEACRGEGGVLRRLDGTAFMERYHPQGDLAPRDVVARAIDSEMKRTGDAHVLLDLTHLPADRLTDRFPGIHERLAGCGIDLCTEPIPVVPAAHYCCGGVSTDTWGMTHIPGLLAAGETAHTGLHGANRLASNSLLETLVFADRAARISTEIRQRGATDLHPEVPDWNPLFASPQAENVLVTHAWDETRRLMWNYVGIVRSNLRLERAKRRLDILAHEIQDDYWTFVVHRDLIELRNLVAVAALVVDCALARQESRGLHYTLDYPDRDDAHWLHDTVRARGQQT